MGTQVTDYATMLVNMEAKRAALDAAIASIRAAMAIGALGAPGDIPEGGSATSGMIGVGVYGAEVPAGAFFGKSIPEAAKLYLEIVKKKQTSREIAEALEKGGMETTSKNFVGMVGAVLDRARKAPNTAFVKLGSQWGLSAWYPKGIVNATSNSPKRKGSKKQKKTTKSAPSQVKSVEGPTQTVEKVAGSTAAPVSPSTTTSILQFFQDHPDFSYPATHVAESTGAKLHTVQLILGKLVSLRKIHKTDAGDFRLRSA